MGGSRRGLKNNTYMIHAYKNNTTQRTTLKRTRRRLHQRGAAQEDGAGPADDDALVGHGGHVRAARRAGAEDDGHLFYIVCVCVCLVGGKGDGGGGGRGWVGMAGEGDGIRL